MLGNLMYQTRPPDEVLCFVSGTFDPMRLAEDFPFAQFHPQPNLNDWGNEKCRRGVSACSGDYLGFFNHDDTYHHTYLAKMLAEAERGADAVWCDWNECRNASFQIGSSTRGNFIVRTSIAKQVGYPTGRYESDGDFIEGIRAVARTTAKVSEVLYHHNAPGTPATNERQ